MNTSGRPVKREEEERQSFAQRAWFGFALLLLALAALGLRFFWLQVVEHGEFSTRARNNRVHLRHLPPPRGLILDRNGVLLADNRPAFRLEVVPERVRDMDAMLTELRALIPLSETTLATFRKQVTRYRSFQRVPLKFELGEKDIATFAVHAWRFPGVDVQPYLTRVYPAGSDFVHVVGYVGRLDAEALARVDQEAYLGTTHIGKTGIEEAYEGVLHGRPGYELAEVNAEQRPLRVLERSPPQAGQDIYLTIDARIQAAAATALGEQAGSVVAIDPRNGEVLAFVSRPGFNPNPFVNGISQREYDALLANPQNPFLNRALRGIYPPGSTIKPFIGLIGLQSGLRKPDDTVFSSGVWHLPGDERGYRDDVRGGVGRVDLRQSVARSVNTYFYQLAYELGIDRLAAAMRPFGFGAPTGIDIGGEASGVLPSREWKRAHRAQPWYPGETVLAGIGQGYWAVTPLQLAHAVATLANGGWSHRPHLLLARGAPERRETQPEATRVGSPDTAPWKVIREAMVEVVHGERGTARGLGDGFPYHIAGKTGTAERYSRTSDAWTPRGTRAELAQLHRALFVAFTPAEAPRIAVAVIVDEGAWGSTAAAPVARKVLDAWLAAQRADGAPEPARGQP